MKNIKHISLRAVLVAPLALFPCALVGCSEYEPEPEAQVAPDTPPGEGDTQETPGGGMRDGSSSTLGKAKDSAENLKNKIEDRDEDMRRIIDGEE